jgi:hypothetical protein
MLMAAGAETVKETGISGPISALSAGNILWPTRQICPYKAATRAFP